MSLRPLSNWRAVLRRAWSVRFIAAAAVLSGLEAGWPYLDTVIDVPPGAFALGAALLSFAALVARHIAQRNLSGE